LKILCLGAGGFIGSHLSSRLIEDNHEITGVDTHQDKIEDLLASDSFRYIEQDICADGFSLEPLVQESDLVIDLIAYANPATYVDMPLDVFRLNFSENLKIAEACVKYRKRLIQFSSCEVYGKTVVSQGKEKLNDPDDPSWALFSEDQTDFLLGPIAKHRWIYSCAKQLLERVLHAYGLQKMLNYTIIRPFNFIGPGIDYLPEQADGSPRVFSHFMGALLQGTDMLLVDGGQHRRCYTYIDDAIDAIKTIVENPEGVCDCQIFNIGSPDNETSIKELAELMRDLYRQEFIDDRESETGIREVSAEEFYGFGYEDSDRRIPDISKARKLLGWNPTWGLKNLLLKTMDFYIAQSGFGQKKNET